MDSKSLKTSVWQRVVILIIAILLLGSTFLTYMFIFMGSNNETTVSSAEQKAEQLMEDYDNKNAEITEVIKPLSDKYFDEFQKYASGRIKAYNETTANNSVLKKEDLKVGTGRELSGGDTDYLAYYVGWCADGTIFDSSYNNQGKEEEQPDPTGLNAPLDPSIGLIEGWNQGVVGMKLGGVRELTISGELAYGETRPICGGTNKPLKYVVMAIEPDENLAKLRQELQEIYIQLYMAYYNAGTQ